MTHDGSSLGGDSFREDIECADQVQGRPAHGRLAEIERLRAVGVDQDPLGRRSATDYGVGVRPTVAGPMAERLSADD